MTLFFGIIGAMKPISASSRDFPVLIMGGYVHVDKTAQLYKLVKP